MLTLISPGYCTFSSISFAISLAKSTASSSFISDAFAITLISRPAFIAYACFIPRLSFAIFSISSTLFKKLSKTSLLAPGLAALKTSAAQTAAASTLNASSCP